MYIYMQVSLGIAQLNKMRYTYMPQALKQTHTLFYKELMIFSMVMPSLDFWSAVDKDKAPDSSNDTNPHSAGTLIIK